MELDTKFQEAMKAVESAILEVDLTKMQYKDKLKKREKDDSSQQAVGAGKATPDKAKKSKKAEGDKSLKPQSLQPRWHLIEPERQGMRFRNKRSCSTCGFSSSMEISSLMRLVSPGRRL